MDSQDEWFTEKLSNLLQEDLRISTLTELKDHLKSLSHEEATRISNVLQLPPVFDCLNDSNSEQVDLACDVLSFCLSNLNLGESTTRYSIALERALIHPFVSVKKMALTEIERSLSDEEVLYELCKKTSLIINIMACLGDSDLGVAKKALNIISSLGTTVPGINKIVSNEVLIYLDQVMNINEVVRLRIYEMIIDISKQSEHSFNKMKSTGLIEKITDELETNDILLKMNIIEILSRFGQSDHGYVFLDESGILKKIFSLLNEDELNTQLCQPGILKFFGYIGHRKPREMFVKYPRLFDILFSNIESSDVIIAGISLDTIGFIGQTSEGKLVLESTGNGIEVVIKTISKLLGSYPTETRVRALNTIENLLRVLDNRSDIMKTTQKWYKSLGSEPMEVILRYAKNPFSELRLAGLGILNALAGQPWGQEEIKNTPGLVEFLLDRSVETIKEAKEAKYEIVKLLSNSAEFDHHTLEKFQTHVKEGPFYVQTVMEVAIEGN